MSKKLFLYEVDPLFFYDANNDGFGDFKGLSQKINYFQYLNIDAILLPDIFNQEEIIAKDVQISIYDKYGNLKQLKKMIDDLQKNNIDIYVQIDLKNILKSMILKTSFKDIFQPDISKYIEEDNSSKFKILNWNTKRRIDAFKKIINFWTKLNVNNFVFINFEQLYDKNNKLDKKLLYQLKFLYELTKEINHKCTIGLRSMLFNNKTINYIFQNLINVMCDFYIDSSYSLFATNKQHPFELQKPFNCKMLSKKLKTLKIPSKYNWKYFISINNNKIGRVNSRWLNEEILIDESNKCLLMFTNLLLYSTVNYYGDELGLLRLNIRDKKDFFDYEYNEKKRALEFNNYKIDHFEESQKYLSKINAQSFFIWNDKKNGGFTKSDFCFRKLPINYLTHNWENEFNDKNSILNFYKNLITINKNIDLDHLAKRQKIKIQLKKKIFIIKIIEETNQNIILINLSNKSINKKLNEKWRVVSSTITNKKYLKNIESLSPYESLVLVKKNN